MIKKVAIIGGGPAGLFAAYMLRQSDKDIKIDIYEQGHSLENRSCPIMTNKVTKCVNCKSCSIMEGVGGAGAFSDGKYNITTEFGGWLQDFIPSGTVIDYIEMADKILQEFGATTKRYMPNDSVKLDCLQHNLRMLQSQ